MNKRELVQVISQRCPELSEQKSDQLINSILEKIISSLNDKQRVEIRGFGIFSLRQWGPRHARNPVTGESWRTPSVYAVHFKPGKELKERVNHLQRSDA
ncbi:MAG: integration host factor subunit beta [Legionellales bacterium]|nr:integration host factor subunit beta [Legionellales bacterium]